MKYQKKCAAPSEILLIIITKYLANYHAIM